MSAAPSDTLTSETHGQLGQMLVELIEVCPTSMYQGKYISSLRRPASGITSVAAIPTALHGSAGRLWEGHCQKASNEQGSQTGGFPVGLLSRYLDTF